MTAQAEHDKDTMLMSQQTVAALHRAYMQRITEHAQSLLGDRQDPNLLQALVKLQVVAGRKYDEATIKELKLLAQAGIAAVTARTWELEGKKFFTPQQQKKIDAAGENRTHHPQISAVFGDNKRIYLDVIDEGEDATRTENNVRKHLAHFGYQVTDYIGGYASDASGKQSYRIGKLLQEHAPFILDSFTKDTRRLRDTMVVISCDADDIARMSTGRKWASCMAAWRAEFDAFAHKDIEHGALVAYLVSKNDPEIHAPLARVMIRPYTNRHHLDKPAPPVDLRKKSLLHSLANLAFGTPTDSTRAGAPAAQVNDTIETVFIPERTVHGLRSDGLFATALEFATRHLNTGKPDGAYYLTPQLYCDTGSSREYAKKGSTLTPVRTLDDFDPF